MSREKPRGWSTFNTYGMFMVKPRTAGTREMRATEAAGNFVASADRKTTGCRRRHQQTKARRLRAREYAAVHRATRRGRSKSELNVKPPPESILMPRDHIEECWRLPVLSDVILNYRPAVLWTDDFCPEVELGNHITGFRGRLRGGENLHGVENNSKCIAVSGRMITQEE